MNNQRFSPEYKDEAVRQVVDQGESSVESFFSSLKKERIKKRIYKTRGLACEDVFDYIEVFLQS